MAGYIIHAILYLCPTSDGVVQPANRNMLEKAVSWIYHGRYAFPCISSVNVHETVLYRLYNVYAISFVDHCVIELR